jgi:murein DD-endopeptidase MepM/ murein hydrolase activator NlpD
MLRLVRRRFALRLVFIGAVGALITGVGPSAAPAQVERPFGLPFRDRPGPSTWLLGQAYGNTTGAHRQRNTTYRAGQGLHFGLDLSAPCGTELIAMADGVVRKVDAPEHGSAPHNLVIDHPQLGYAVLYGHLLERPQLQVGQQVRRGDAVAKSGDPDETCTSRPHLHLEIRNSQLNRAYNPVELINADWDSFSLIGSFGRGFARDLEQPRRWQHLNDQPETAFGGVLLNNYANPWPPQWGVR